MDARKTLRSIEQRTVTALGRTLRVAELAVAAVAVLGLLLVLPSIASPTSRLVLSDPGRGSVLSDQRWWSWGRVVTGNGDSYDRVFPNTAGLVLLVVSLVIAVLAVLGWLWRPGRVGALMGVLGLTVATVRVTTAVTERLGRDLPASYDDSGLDARSYLQSAGVSETAAAVLLLVALAGLVALTLRSPHLPVGVGELGGAGSQPSAEPREGTETGSSLNRSRTSEVSSPEGGGIRTARDGTTAAPGGSRLTAPDTGFRDEPPDRPQRPDHRFEPPT